MPGELVSLEIRCPEHTLTEIQWTIPGTIFKDYQTTQQSAVLTGVANAGLKQKSVAFYWADAADSREVKVAFKIGDTQCVKKAIFHVKRPGCSFASLLGKTQLIPPNRVKLTAFGSALSGIKFTAQTSMPVKPVPLAPFPEGTWQFVQVAAIRPVGRIPGPILFNRTTAQFEITSSDVYPYPVPPPPYPQPPFAANGQTITTTDSPEYTLNAVNFVKFRLYSKDNYSMYVMFRPNNGKWIPLQLIKWEWSFYASYDGAPPSWVLFTPEQATGQAENTSVHPQWNAQLVNPSNMNLPTRQDIPFCGS